MPGLAKGELMHEWMEADTPGFDVPGEEITKQLLRDNEIMLDLIRELGGEAELRRRLSN